MNNLQDYRIKKSQSCHIWIVPEVAKSDPTGVYVVPVLRVRFQMDASLVVGQDVSVPKSVIRKF